MKRVAFLTSILFFAASSCAHTVSIDSKPRGAEVFVNGSPIGRTPTQFTERTGSGKSYLFKLEKEGYQTLVMTRTQSEIHIGVLVGSIIGGVAILFPFIGLIWMYQLPSLLYFELDPL